MMGVAKAVDFPLHYSQQDNNIPRKTLLEIASFFIVFGYNGMQSFTDTIPYSNCRTTHSFYGGVSRTNHADGITKDDSSQAIMCVSCNSLSDSKDEDCENSPPSASSCLVTDSLYCVVIRELSKDGKQIKFIRDCSTLSNSTCSIYADHAPGFPYKVCYQTCKDGDGCNHAARPYTTWWTLGALILVTTTY